MTEPTGDTPSFSKTPTASRAPFSGASVERIRPCSRDCSVALENRWNAKAQHFGPSRKVLEPDDNPSRKEKVNHDDEEDVPAHSRRSRPVVGARSRVGARPVEHGPLQGRNVRIDWKKADGGERLAMAVTVVDKPTDLLSLGRERDT
jgi:hypothetical protein